MNILNKSNQEEELKVADAKKRVKQGESPTKAKARPKTSMRPQMQSEPSFINLNKMLNKHVKKQKMS